MAEPGFVHLHVHSSYSLLEGALTIARLAELAKADRQPALALTDTDNMFGALEFSDKIAGAGIQPIVGCALAVDFGDQEGGPRAGGPLLERPRIVLLAARENGYRSLMRLNSRAFLDTPPNEQPHLKLAWLAGETDGLIALTGGPGGPLDTAIVAGQSSLAGARCEALAQLFGDRLYVELQRHGSAAERTAEASLIELAYARDLPLVATNEPFFATREDYEAHDALICIAEGRLVAETDRRQLTAEHRFKSRAEMTALFADLPEAVAATVEIAQRCAFRPRIQAPILPRFSVGEGGAAVDEAAELRKRAEAGLERRIRIHGIAGGRTVEEYRERLAFELNVIEGMKYPGYFLIVSDFIQWAKAQGIPVGPGRGSGAGSLVSYALTITDLDPIRFGLLFERFLNPERVSMPDFDIDFCQDRRDEVIRYVQERYGSEKVAQIITFGTLQARGVLRDVGRVLQMPYGQVDKFCKLVPQNPLNPVTLGRAIDDEPRLQAARDGDPVVRRAFDIAQKLEGLHRHASTHAAGIVIGERPLTEMVPLYRDPKSLMPVTQFNMKWVEQAGLVKFDFLGLKTLTVLETAVALARRRGAEIELASIPLDDEKTYAMLARAEAVGIFQLESQGMRRALLDMRPDRFEDIIALVALYRPGPMANIPTYCARKHAREQPDYIHPKLEPILRETFGVIVYQEQVMQAAQILAGYSLGEADLLRRAMGKKIRKEMQAQRERFVSGCVERGLDRGQAETIFELLERFADYGFNKSHAAAYALVAYQTAYMKANYPVEFLAASMTLDMGNTDKLAEFRAEAERLGVKVEPPSINRSGVAFEVEGKTIHYALAALKGVGRQAVEAIVEARGEPAVRRPCRFRRPHQSARGQQARAGKPHRGRCLRRAGRQSRPRLRRRRRHAGGRATRLTTTSRSGSCGFVRRGGDPRRAAAAGGRAVAARRAAAEGIRRHRVLPDRPSARRLRARAQAHAGAVLGRIRARGARGRQRRPRRRHRGGAHRAAHPDRQQDGHHRAIRSVRAFRGGGVLGRAGAVSRSARARRRGAADALGRAAGRRRARAHPDGRAARSGGRQALEGAAGVSAREAPVESVAKRLEGSGSAPARRRQGRRRGLAGADARARAPRSRSSFPAASRSRRRSPAPSRRCPGVVAVEAL